MTPTRSLGGPSPGFAGRCQWPGLFQSSLATLTNDDESGPLTARFEVEGSCYH